MVSPRCARAVILCLAGALLSTPAALPAQSTEANIAKVVSLMQADHYDYKTTRSASVWTIHFVGKHLSDIKVVVAPSTSGDDDALVVFVTVVEKRRMPVTTDFMRTLLEQNHNLDRVKVGFDKDGDLSVRVDAALRVTDPQEFKDIVTQVETSSDEIYGLIEPSLQP